MSWPSIDKVLDRHQTHYGWLTLKRYKDEIIKHAPSLADIFSLNSSAQDEDEMVREIVRKVRRSESPSTTPPSSPTAIPSTDHSFAVFYIAQAQTPELPQDKKPEPSFFAIDLPPGSWVSMVTGDKELEYISDGTTLRVRLDWGNHWSGDEILAHQLVTEGQPFALTLRHSSGGQKYLRLLPTHHDTKGHELKSIWVDGVSNSTVTNQSAVFSDIGNDLGWGAT